MHNEAESKKQSNIDRGQITIRPINNGLLVKLMYEWYTFTGWKEASTFIGSELEKRKEIK